MVKAPTQDQIQKMFKCTDTFVDSMNKLDNVVAKLNTAALNLEAEFLQPQRTEHNYESKKRNLEASRKADEEVQRLIDEYEKMVIAINDNISYYNTLITYQTNMGDLTEYYNTTITTDKQKIEALKSKKAIAQRMTTYYKNKDENVSWYNYYLKILYWIISGLLIGFFVYLLFGKAKHKILAKMMEECKDPGRAGKGQGGAIDEMCNKILPTESSNTIQPGPNSDKFPVVKTGITLVFMLLTPYIIQPVVNLVKPYLFPYT